jgi:hypothetical protein
MSGIPLSNRHNRVYASSPFYSTMETSSFHNNEFTILCASLFLEHKMMDKVQISVVLTVIYKRLLYKQDNSPIYMHKIWRELKCMEKESIYITSQCKSDFYSASTECQTTDSQYCEALTLQIHSNYW